MELSGEVISILRPSGRTEERAMRHNWRLNGQVSPQQPRLKRGHTGQGLIYYGCITDGGLFMDFQHMHMVFVGKGPRRRCVTLF